MSKPASSPIPPGFHALTVHLSIVGAADYVDFLKRAFDAIEISRSPGPGGKLMHVQMRIGDSMIMFADDFGAEFGMPPLAKGRLPFHMHLYVSDADAVWNKAVAAACTITMPIGDQFWGDRYGHLLDPFGVNWAIGSRKEELTAEEVMERQKAAFAGGHP